MTEEAVLNWDKVLHKNVRANDRNEVGTVIRIAGDKITVAGGSKRQYEIPKRNVEGFDGSEVYLDIPYSEIGKFKSQ